MKNTSNNSTTAKRELKRRRRELNNEMSFTDWRADAYSETTVLRMVEDLELSMLEDEKMISVTKWLLKYKISYDSVSRFKDRFPEFKYRYESVLQLLASRMSDYSFWKQGDFNTFRFVAPSYCKRFEKLEEWRAKLKEATEQQRPQIIYVERPDIHTEIPQCTTKKEEKESE
jgi:hypothetical protein